MLGAERLGASTRKRREAIAQEAEDMESGRVRGSRCKKGPFPPNGGRPYPPSAVVQEPGRGGRHVLVSPSSDVEGRPRTGGGGEEATIPNITSGGCGRGQ